MAKRLRLFEAPLASPSGLSFEPGADNGDLMRVAEWVHYLRTHDITVKRANLSTNPKAFLDEPSIMEHLSGDGDTLPVTYLDDEVVLKGRYPSNEELAEWFDLPELKDGPPPLDEETLEFLRIEAMMWGGCGPSSCASCPGCH